MLIKRVAVYGLEESIIASGLPKSTEEDGAEYSMERAHILAGCKPGTGHDCFLKGIIVQANLTAPSYWWPQFQRYHFADIISSQSKMHCLNKFDVESMCNGHVDYRILEILRTYIDSYNKNKTIDNFVNMVSNVPMGMNLTARVTLNYLQLKTIYIQRRGHKLPDWEDFCSWIRSLPEADKLIIVGKTANAVNA